MKVGIGTAFGGTDKTKSLLFGNKFGPSNEAKETQSKLKSLQDQSIDAQVEAFQRLRKMAQPGAGKDMIRQQVGREERLARGGFSDQMRSIREKLAQRGLGRSSIGLQAETSAQRSLTDRLRDIRSTLGTRQQAEEERRQQILLTGGAGGLGAAGNFQQVLSPQLQSGRAGGMLQPLMAVGGGIAGGIMGGPAGAQAGSQIGSGVGGAIQGSQEQKAMTRY